MPDQPSPAAAPSPTAVTPTPAAQPDPGSPPPNPAFDDAYSDIAGLAGTPEPLTPTQAKAQPKAKPAEKPTAAEKPPTETPPAKPDAKPPEPGKDVKGKSPDQPQGAKELRTALETQTREVSRLKTELDIAKKQFADKGELESLRKDLADAKKAREDLQNELRYANYERSQEYKEKYEAPLEDALKTAYDDVSQLSILSEDGTKTKATADHFNALLQMNLQDAAEKAVEWFGNAANIVMDHRKAVMGLDSARRKAIDSFKKEAGEREKQTTEQRQQAREAITKRWEAYHQTMHEKYPQFFKADETDPKGNDLLTKGFTLADKAFGIGTEGLTPQQIVDIQAEVRNRAAAFGRMVYRNNQLQDRVKALETELEGYKTSGNPKPKEGGDHEFRSGDQVGDSDAEIAALVSA